MDIRLIETCGCSCDGQGCSICGFIPFEEEKFQLLDSIVDKIASPQNEKSGTYWDTKKGSSFSWFSGAVQKDTI